MARLAFRSAIRTATVELLTDYAAAEGIGLQIYRARPATIKPPTAFIESIPENLTEFIISARQREPAALVRIVWGLFDSGAAVDQADAFVDGFLDWTADNYHAAGANTLIAATRVVDDPTWVPDWLPQDQQRVYFSILVTLEGFTAT